MTERSEKNFASMCAGTDCACDPPHELAELVNV